MTVANRNRSGRKKNMEFAVSQRLLLITRGLHNRTDYPLTDPMLDGKAVSIKKVKGEVVVEFRRAE